MSREDKQVDDSAEKEFKTAEADPESRKAPKDTDAQNIERPASRPDQTPEGEKGAKPGTAGESAPAAFKT